MALRIFATKTNRGATVAAADQGLIARSQAVSEFEDPYPALIAETYLLPAGGSPVPDRNHTCLLLRRLGRITALIAKIDPSSRPELDGYSIDARMSRR